MTNELLKAWLECLKRDLRCECCINDECEHCDLLKKQGTLKERIDALDKVIKALEQQPCEDCISREQTLKTFAEKCGGECACCEYNGSGYDTAENCKLIKSMPSVTPQPKWIPVTERLPEIGQRILVTYNQEDEVKIDITDYTKHGFLLSVVKAWMPLPEPYKAESEVNADDD